MTQLRVTIELLDEDGDVSDCKKTTCRMCGDRRQVRIVDIDPGVNGPYLTSRAVAGEARDAVLDMFEGGCAVDGTPNEQDDRPDLD